MCICIAHNIVWTELPTKLAYNEFLKDEGLVRAIPSKSTFIESGFRSAKII
ncbi:MAG: hypothetical protein OEY49_08040 [Candidatus Heimdallarchaeota archaeon]|nr:hypothetical protein [Candidatus Heimdallarchaeota archaeon]